GRGERLEQHELAAARDSADAFGHFDVVDCVLQPIGQRTVRNLELHVEEEVLALLTLLLGHTVAAEDLQPVELDEDHIPTTAAATVSACTCSRTSWTRRIEAPRS